MSVNLYRSPIRVQNQYIANYSQIIIIIQKIETEKNRRYEYEVLTTSVKMYS